MRAFVLLLSYVSIYGPCIFLIIAFGSLEELESLDDGPKITADTKPNLIVSAKKLCKDYNANEIAADEKYK